jgi:hypothetical protein
MFSDLLLRHGLYRFTTDLGRFDLLDSRTDPFAVLALETSRELRPWEDRPKRRLFCLWQITSLAMLGAR